MSGFQGEVPTAGTLMTLLGTSLAHRGSCVTGGGALVKHIDELLTQVTGIPCFVADNPLACVAMGTGMALENLEVLKDSLSDD